MNKVGEGSTAKIAVACVDSILKAPNLPVHKSVYAINIGFEVLHKLLVYGLPRDVYHVARYFLAHHLALCLAYADSSIAHQVSIARRVQTQHVFACIALYPTSVTGMVVSEKNDVEPLHFACYRQRSILIVVGGVYSAFAATMEKADNNIGFLFCLDVFHPILGRFNHVVEPQTRPQTLL